MPSAYLLGPLVIKSSLIIVLISFIIGTLFFYLTSPDERKTKKQNLTTITDFLLVYMVSIIGAKIVLHFDIFLKNPIVVLAFPSNSHAYYLASIVMVGYLFWLVKRKKLDIIGFFESFIRVALAAGFLSLFAQLVLTTDVVSIYQLGLYVILLVSWLGLQDKVSSNYLVLITMSAWGLVHAVITWLDATQLFGFFLAPWFYLLIGLTSVFLLLKTDKKT